MVIPAAMSFGPFATAAVAGGQYLVTIQATVTAAAAPVAGNGLVWTLTPDGTAPVAVKVTTQPIVGDVNWGCTASCVVNIPVTGTQIVLSGVNSVVAWPTGAPVLTNVKVTYARIA
jgi:hypothetical protein